MTYATDIHPRTLHGADAAIASPLGTLLLARTEDGLAGAWFETQKHHPARSTRPSATTIRCCSGAARAARAPTSTARAMRFDLPLDLQGTAFQRDVWQRAAAHRGRRDAQLRRHRARARHPVGEPRRRRGGRPQPASRSSCPAIASSAASGALTGYAGGLDRKTSLLRIEADRAASRAKRAPAGASLRRRDVAELLALAALWGASFLFMRVAVPAFGPVALAFAARRRRRARCSCRCSPCAAISRSLRRHWRTIAVVGCLNSALPFLCFAYAALTINAGVSAIFNSATPLFAAIVAWLWLGDRMTPLRVVGLAIGFAGVLWIGWDKADFGPGGSAVAIVACLLATMSYGVAPSLTKRHLSGVPPLAVAAGSQVAAPRFSPSRRCAWPARAVGRRMADRRGAVVLLHRARPTPYFRLIANAGPANAVAVTYLIPIFAVVWGGIFLDERLTCRWSRAAPSSSPARRSRPESSGREYRNDRYDRAACGTVARPAAAEDLADANRRLPTSAERASPRLRRRRHAVGGDRAPRPATEVDPHRRRAGRVPRPVSVSTVRAQRRCTSITAWPPAS